MSDHNSSDPDPPHDTSAQQPAPRTDGEAAAGLSVEFLYDPALLLDPDTDRAAHDREWNRVFGDFNPRLQDYFAGRTDNGDELDELVRHIWRKALLGLGKLRSTRAAWNWLVSVGENRIRDMHRAAKARYRWQERMTHEAIVDGDLCLRLPNALERMASNDPFDENRWPVDRDTFMVRWKQLPELDRQMIWLHDVEGWTHREIAEVLGIAKPGTARQRFSRARLFLREGRS